MEKDKIMIECPMCKSNIFIDKYCPACGTKIYDTWYDCDEKIEEVVNNI